MIFCYVLKHVTPKQQNMLYLHLPFLWFYYISFIMLVFRVGCGVLDKGSEPAYILLKVQMDSNE